MTTTHILHLRDGDLEISEPASGRFVVAWKPHRTDHPDYPGVRLDSQHDDFPTGDGIGGAERWAEDYFGSRDKRDLFTAVLDVHSTEEEAAAVSRVLDEGRACDRQPQSSPPVKHS